MVVRCTGKLLNLLGGQSVALVDSPPSTDDWYANLLWVDQRKCLLVAHAGTLFALIATYAAASTLELVHEGLQRRDP